MTDFRSPIADYGPDYGISVVHGWISVAIIGFSVVGCSGSTSTQPQGGGTPPAVESPQRVKRDIQTGSSVGEALEKNAESAGISFKRDSDGHIHVLIRDKPDDLLILDASPPAIEPELLSGRWLIVVFSILSNEDVSTAYRCRKLTSKLAGIAKIAIRPTMDFHETGEWLPGYDRMAYHATPLWIIIENGIVVRWHGGGMNDQLAIEFARK